MKAGIMIMSLVRIAALVGLMGALAATQGILPNGTRVVLPGGTLVTVVVVNPISSSTAKVGDSFAVTAKENVVVNGWVAIQKGAPGQGEVTAVTPAGSHGKAGSLGIQMDWIFAADGEKVRLANQKASAEGESKAGVSSTMTILSWVVLGPVGLFAHNWVKGRDVTLDDTRPLQAYVSDSVYVVATSRVDTAEDGFAKAVGGDSAAKTPIATQSRPSPRPLH